MKMDRAWIKLLGIVVVLLFLSVSCSGGSQLTNASVLQREAVLAPADASEDNSSELAFNPDEAINREGFSLFVLDEAGKISAELRRYYDLRARILANGDAFLSIVAINHPPSKASLFILKYNPQDYKFKQASPGKFYGGTSESVFLVIDKYGGTLPIGVARIRPAEKGFTQGDGLIAELFFTSGPSDKPKEALYTPPPGAVIFQNLEVKNDGSANVISWQDRLKGDYDNSGTVDIADIVPVAEYFFGEVGDGVNDPIESFIDGNGDGIVAIDDIPVIAENFFAKVLGYNVYRSATGRSGEKRLPNPSPEKPYSVMRENYQPFSLVDYTYRDTSYEEDMPGGGPVTFTYRVVLVGDTGESSASNSAEIQLGAGADTLPPHDPSDRLKPYAGVISVDAGNGRLKITYKLNASDAQPTGQFTPADEIRYFLYLGYRDPDTGLIDMENLILPNEQMDGEITGVPSPFIWDDLDPTTPTKEPLINGQEYAVYIAAEDNAGNRTTPVAGTVGFGIPFATAHNDFDPPVWVNEVGITSVTPGNGGVRVEFGSAVDLLSPPVRYRLYYSTSSAINFETTPFIEITNSPYSLTGLTNDTGYYLVVRAIDSADRYDPPIQPNETTNTTSTFVTPRSTLPDITPPTWVDTVGVQRLVAGDGSIRVEFGVATDAESQPVSYRIYYQVGTSVDFDANTQLLEVSSNFPPPYLQGLANGTEYAVIVRAVDALGNEEKNTVTLSATPNTGLDNLPPSWDPAGIQGVVPLNGAVDAVWQAATDDTPPIIYRVFWEEGDSGISDYQRAVTEGRYADTTETAFRIEGLNNGTIYSFAVRARDSVEPPNEDWNTVFLTAVPSAGPFFSTEVVDSRPDPVVYSSIAVSPANNEPGIAYATANEFEPGKFRHSLYFATHESGSWEIEQIGSALDSLGEMPSIAFASDGTAYIAYVETTGKYLDPPRTRVEVARRNSPGSWQRLLVDAGGDNTIFVYPSIDIKKDGTPAVAYISYDSQNASYRKKLWYASFNGSEWQKEMIPGVSAGGGSRVEGGNCALKFGEFDVESVFRERATIAFTDPSRSDNLRWVFQGESIPWVVWNVDTSGSMSYVDLTFWREKLGGSNYTDWPRISYRIEMGNGMFVSALKVNPGPPPQLVWERRLVDQQDSPGSGFFSNVEVLKKGTGGFELTYVAGRSGLLMAGRMGIENLVTGDYTVYTLPPTGSADSGTSLSMAKKKVLTTEKAVFSMISQGNLHYTEEL